MQKNINLKQLKKQTRDIISKKVTLADAQCIIASGHGFDSCAKINPANKGKF